VFTPSSTVLSCNNNTSLLSCPVRGIHKGEMKQRLKLAKGGLATKLAIFSHFVARSPLAAKAAMGLTLCRRPDITAVMKCRVPGCHAEAANLGELNRHVMADHPAVWSDRLNKSRERRSARAHSKKTSDQPPAVTAPAGVGGDGHGASGGQSLATASFVHVSPRPFNMSPVYLWRAKETCINEWGWPKDMSDEDFVDTFFYVMCYKCGKDLDKAGDVIKQK